MQVAIDTSTSRSVLAILDGENALFEWAGPSGTFHGETLLEGLDSGLQAAGIKMPDLRFVSIGIGPGTFTGLRIGVVMAKFLADAGNLPVVPVSSLQAQALSALGVKAISSSVRIWSLTDAKRHEVYAFSCLASELNKDLDFSAEQEAALRPETLAERLGAGDILLGEGAENYSQFWPETAKIAAPEWRYLRGRSIGWIGWSKFQKNQSLSAVEIAARYFKTEKF